MPDAYAGELPMAYVVLNPGSKLSAADLIQYCNKHISERAAIPKRIELIDAMPLTAVGKIFRPRLRQMIAETIVSEVLASMGLTATISSETEKKRGLVINITVDDKDRIAEVNSMLQSYIFTSQVS